MRKLFVLWLGFVGVSPVLADTDGARIYANHCAACHQVDAVGTLGIAPPLAGTLERYTTNADGMRYLLHVPLTGLNGAITVNGANYNSNMPSFAKLSDIELTQVMTHILVTYNNMSDLSWLTPEFVASIRKEAGSSSDTRKMRQRLQTNSGG